MYLLRHGQSLFNLHFTATRQDPGIEDPELTELGCEQAAQAAVWLADKVITRVIISPYTRALQTAEPVLRVHEVPVEIMHEVRERYAFSCDVGRHRDALAAAFPAHEFGHLPDRWWPDEHETHEATLARAAAFRELMRERKDAGSTLLVSHWAFILALSGVSAANGEVLEYDPASPAPEQIVWRP
ncbi:MAG: histidine phosphatase family protein [Acidocella sp. 20-61-6]|nr:MAG: histidine phosphatase family protein [Acidocella sp. 20-61-6]